VVLRPSPQPFEGGKIHPRDYYPIGHPFSIRGRRPGDNFSKLKGTKNHPFGRKEGPKYWERGPKEEDP